MKRAAFLVALWLGLGAVARAEVVDGVAVIVGDEVVLLSEVRTAMQSVLARVPQGQTLSPDEMRQIRDSAVKGLIDDKLVLQIAKQQGVAASEEDIDGAIAGIAEQENLSVDAIYAAAAEQGLDRAAYREQLGKQITRMKIVSGSVQGKVRVSEEDVRKLYDERYGNVKPGERIRVLHILLAVPPDAPPEARAQMRELALKLRAEALEKGDFGALARQFSAAPTASAGGLTVFREADAPAYIKDAIASLKPGEITEPIQSTHGENLFQYLDRFDPSSVTFDQAEPKLRAELVDSRSMPEFEKWIAEVRKNRYVEVVAPELR